MNETCFLFFLFVTFILLLLDFSDIPSGDTIHAGGASFSLRKEIYLKLKKKIEPRQEHEKRVILEIIVSLLRRNKNALSISFLSMLLRAAIYLRTIVACRLDLEKRMGLQLGQAVLDDLLIPCFSSTEYTMLFDVDTVRRIMANYLEHQADGSFSGDNTEEPEYASSPATDMEKVEKLMENYLAEIASNSYLSVSKFIGFAELILEKWRITEDGMYRAVDIYLKAHPALTDAERKSVCSLIDCQKLSREACAHAAQSGKLPVQTVVQVLHYEQQRLHDVTNGNNFTGMESPAKLNAESTDIKELSSLKRENQDLKQELVRMKMRLEEIERSEDKSVVGSSSVVVLTRLSSDKPPSPRKSFMSSVSKKLEDLIHSRAVMELHISMPKAGINPAETSDIPSHR